MKKVNSHDERIAKRTERVNGELHRIVRRLNEANIRIVQIVQANEKRQRIPFAELVIDSEYRILIPTVHPNKGLSFDFVRVSKGKKTEEFYRNLSELIGRYLRIKEQETNKMKKQTVATKAKTPRASTQMDVSRAKREEEIKEATADITALNKALDQVKIAYDGIYNAWCDLEEELTDRASNAKILERIEKLSTDVDGFFGDMKTQREAYSAGIKTAEKLRDAHPQVNAGDAKKTPEAKPTQGGDFKTFVESKGIEFKSLKYGSTKYHKLLEEFTSKGKPKVKVEPKAKFITSGSTADPEVMKQSAQKVNEFIGIFVPELKNRKIRVADTQKATVKRNGILFLTRGRQVEITHGGVAIFTAKDGKGTVTAQKEVEVKQVNKLFSVIEKS